MSFIKRLRRVTGYIVTVALTRKTMLRLLLLSIPVGAITGAMWLSAHDIQLNASQKAGPLLLFLACGCINLALLFRKTYFPGLEFIPSPLAYSLVLSILLAALLLIYNNGRQLDMALACSAAFLLPIVMNEAWRYYRAIYSTSSMGERSGESDDDVMLTGTVSIWFIVEAGNAMVAAGRYKAEVPECWKLSRAFYSVFQRDNRFQQDDESCYGWEFFHETFMGTSRSKLDAKRSVEDNGLRRHSVIKVKPTMIHRWQVTRPLKLTDYSKN